MIAAPGLLRSALFRSQSKTLRQQLKPPLSQASNIVVRSPGTSGSSSSSTGSSWAGYCSQRQHSCAASSSAGQLPPGSPEKPLEPALYLVGTPIGNLEDISFRALRILKSVNLILAEDTRHTRKLLEYFSIRTPTLSCHQHNEKQRQELVLQRLQQGEPIALVSDAGMPAISDPGALMVSAAVAAGVKVVPVPGPCAAIAALAAAGLSTDSFYFVGFLPAKSGRRKVALQQLRHLSATLVFYAPPHGLSSILTEMVDILGPERQAVVARELTKLHEEFFRASLADVLVEFGPSGKRAVKGEVVLLVAGCFPDQQQYLAAQMAASESASEAAAYAQSAGEHLLQLLQKELSKGGSVSATAKRLSQQLQLPRSKIYKVALEVASQLQQEQAEQLQQQSQGSDTGT